MDVLNGTTIFLLIAIGMVAGSITQVFIWNKGVSFVTNLVTGVIGSVVVGSISMFLNFPAGLMFGFLGSLTILFITNVFHLQPEGSH